jgi:hypothetical protein
MIGWGYRERLDIATVHDAHHYTVFDDEGLCDDGGGEEGKGTDELWDREQQRAQQLFLVRPRFTML